MRLEPSKRRSAAAVHDPLRGRGYRRRHGLALPLDDMGLANDTIVVYSSDNGPHMNSWPDGAMTWFRSEKNTNWEGAFRVPCLVRWPGVIKPGTVTNELMSHTIGHQHCVRRLASPISSTS